MIFWQIKGTFISALWFLFFYSVYEEEKQKISVSHFNGIFWGFSLLQFGSVPSDLFFEGKITVICCTIVSTKKLTHKTKIAPNLTERNQFQFFFNIEMDGRSWWIRVYRCLLVSSFVKISAHAQTYIVCFYTRFFFSWILTQNP